MIRLARGNPGHRPINRDEPLPPALPAAWPEELAEDAEAQAEWVRTIVPAIDTGQITAADRVFAISHCHFWSTWRSQLADAAKHAHVVSVGKNKYPMGNPARIMANRTFLLLAKVDAELGLTPSSRPRVKGIKAPGGPHSNINRYLNVLPGGKVSSR